MTPRLCQKIMYKNDKDEKIVLMGVIEKEDDFFIHFTTDARKFRFHKSMILSIAETNKEFRGYEPHLALGKSI